MTDWRLRRATSADAAAAGMVATASFMAAFFDDLGIADMLAHCATHCSEGKFAAWLDDGTTIVTLAEHPATAVPVAYTVLTAPDLPVAPRSGDIELRRIYLLPVAWGSGVAAALLAQAYDDARGRGAGRMLLGVYGENRRAHRFYEKQGFVRIGVRQFQVGATLHDDFVYARAL